MKKITFCGDDCLCCPRYLAKTQEELEKVAELWYRVGWRDRILPAQEMKCSGCSSHKQCSYHLVECIQEHGVEKCSKCAQFPCEKIHNLLSRSAGYEETCRRVCSAEEYAALEKAFFRKEEYLKV